MPLTIAHMSDVHLAPVRGLGLRHLNIKRGLGFANWLLKRRKVHTRETVDRAGGRSAPAAGRSHHRLGRSRESRSARRASGRARVAGGAWAAGAGQRRARQSRHLLPAVAGSWRGAVARLHDERCGRRRPGEQRRARFPLRSRDRPVGDRRRQLGSADSSVPSHRPDRRAATWRPGDDPRSARAGGLHAARRCASSAASRSRRRAARSRRCGRARSRY